MVRMVTKTAHEYAGKNLTPGDEYDCEEEHVIVVTTMGWSEVIETEETPKRRSLRRSHA